MFFIVNPSHCLPVVRQIAAVKILFAVLAMTAGSLPTLDHLTGLEGISTERTLEVIPSPKISETSRQVRSDGVYPDASEFFAPQNFAPRCSSAKPNSAVRATA